MEDFEWAPGFRALPCSRGFGFAVRLESSAAGDKAALAGAGVERIVRDAP